MPEKDQEQVLEDVKAVFDELVTGLPEGCACINVSPKKETTVIDIMPSNPGAARLRAIVPRKNGVTLVAGHGSFFEIPPEGRRYTTFPLREELKIICQAVIAGRLREQVTFIGSQVLHGTGRIQIPETLTVRWRRFNFRPFQKKERKEFSYFPYC